MSRLQTRFAQLKQENRAALVTFVTAGDPDYASSLEILKGLPAAGADVIELGMPFTDPMADGPATLFLRPADILPVPDPKAPFRVTELASTGALLRVVAQDDAGCRIEAEVPRREGRDLRQGQGVLLRPAVGQIFPGGAPQAAAPVQTPQILKEARS